MKLPKYCKNCGEKLISYNKDSGEFDEQTGESVMVRVIVCPNEILRNEASRKWATTPVSNGKFWDILFGKDTELYEKIRDEHHRLDIKFRNCHYEEKIKKTIKQKNK